MPNSGENIRLQGLVNGEVRGTAGMEAAGVRSVILDWVRRDPAPDEVRKQPDFGKTSGSATTSTSASAGWIPGPASTSSGSAASCASGTRW